MKRTPLPRLTTPIPVTSGRRQRAGKRRVSVTRCPKYRMVPRVADAWLAIKEVRGKASDYRSELDYRSAHGGERSWIKGRTIEAIPALSPPPTTNTAPRRLARGREASRFGGARNRQRFFWTGYLIVSGKSYRKEKKHHDPHQFSQKDKTE